MPSEGAVAFVLTNNEQPIVLKGSLVSSKKSYASPLPPISALKQKTPKICNNGGRSKSISPPRSKPFEWSKGQASPKRARVKSPQNSRSPAKTPTTSYDVTKLWIKEPFQKESSICLQRNATYKAVDVNYITNLRSCFEKIRSSYTCGPTECPSLQQRLHKHRFQHHSNPGSTADDYRTSSVPYLNYPNITDSEAQTRITFTDLGHITISKVDAGPKMRDQSAQNRQGYSEADGLSNSYERVDVNDDNYTYKAVDTAANSYADNNNRSDKNTTVSNYTTTDANYARSDRNATNRNKNRNRASKPIKRYDKTNAGNNKNHTSNIMDNKGRNKDNTNYTDNKEPADGSNIYNEQPTRGIPIKNTETHSVLPSTVLRGYRDKVQEEVKNWLLKVPLFASDVKSADTRTKTENAVNELVDKVKAMANEADTAGYEDKMNREIDKCIDALNMWYPSGKREQATFRNNIRNHLWKKIDEINRNTLYNAIVGNQNQTDRQQGGSRGGSAKNGPRTQLTSEYPTKCTLASGNLCACTNETKGALLSDKKSPCNKSCVSCSNGIEAEITDWVNKLDLLHQDGAGPITKRVLTDILMDRLKPYFNIPSSDTNKAVLKAKIFEIMQELSICIKMPGNRKLFMNKFSDDLANRLLGIQARLESSGVTRKWPLGTMVHTTFQQTDNNISDVDETELRQDILDEVKDCLENTKIAKEDNVAEDITEILYNQLNAVCLGNDNAFKSDACSILERSRKLNNDEILAIIDGIIENIKDIVTIMNSKDRNEKVLLKPCISGTLSVYTSEHEITGPIFSPVAASTPKKATLKKDIPKLNAEELSYQDNIANLTWNWLNNLPKKYNVPEDKGYQEVMVNDLAGEITDYVKSQQLSTDPHLDKDKYIPYFTCKWLSKFGIIENTPSPESETKELINHLKEINVPGLTRPQHGSRQIMDNLRHMEGDLGGKVDFIPKSKDILEDEISIWMNEQPKNIYKIREPSMQDKMIRELAIAIQPKLVKKRSGIDKDIASWLKKMVKTDDEKNIKTLSKHLADRIKKLPQDKTLAAKAEKKVQERKERAEPRPVEQVNKANDEVNASADADKTMRDFIIKYIQHNYEVDDTMARGAFAQLLKTELRKLSASTVEQIYKNPNDKFSPQKLDIELLYIEDVSDWLKNIPIEVSYNRVGNKDRVEFITGLAKSIAEVEIERVHAPLAMDYNTYLGGIICSFMEILPILPDKKVYVTYMIDNLLTKIVSRRPYIEYTVVNKSNSLNQSGVAGPDLSNFVEQYVKVNAQEIADDHLKMDAWSARLLQEVKKIVHNDPNVSQNAIVQANDITKPGEESVKRFDLELEYAEEITEWLKNLPLVSSKDDVIIQMVSNLAEFMSNTRMKKAANPKDKKVDKEFDDYVTKWISELPVDRSKEINLPIVTQQLRNRIEKVDRESTSKEKTLPSSTSAHKHCPVKNIFSKTSKHKETSSVGNPGTILVDVIEKWSKELPFLKKNITEAEIEEAKNDIARRIFQTIGELNDNPGLQHDDFLYKDMLAYQIDSQLEDYFGTIKCKKRKEELKSNLVKDIMSARKAIKDFGIGNDYKCKLENMVESSIPHPMPPPLEDPGFQLYKNRLANLFLLTNFDHSDDTVKMNYENQLKQDIDLYFPCAQSRNGLLMTNEEMLNEFYCSLYKVPIPDSVYLKDEVEDIKTRLEIDAWFLTIPLPDPRSYYELLKWDQMLVTLTKRLREFEKSETNSEEKMSKEITKWLAKLPLYNTNQNEINRLANDLQTRLKATVDNRKCITKQDLVSANNDKPSKASKSKGNTSKVKGIFGTETVAAQTHAKIWISPSLSSLPPYIPEEKPTRKYAQEVLRTVEEWCQQLPLPGKDPTQAADIRENLATKIVIKISELDTNSDTMNDEVMHEHMFDTELETLLSSLPESNELVQSKSARKQMLKDAIKSLQPLRQDEKERVLFIKDLHETVAKVLNEPKNMTPEKMALLDTLRDEIVEGYVEFHYNKQDEQGKHFYKKRIHEALTEYFAKIMTDDKESGSHVDSLLQGNKLICEMGKTPLPSDDAIRDEVLENRMKNEVADLFDDVFPNDCQLSRRKRVDALKSLAKLLNEMERGGHTMENDQKMKGEITKTLRKLDREVSPARIEKFIKDLKQSEPIRKAPPVRKVGTSQPGTQSPTSMPRPRTSQSPVSFAGDDNAGMDQGSSFHPSAGTGGKWYSLEPVTSRDQALLAGQIPQGGAIQSLREPGNSCGGGPTNLHETPLNLSQDVATSIPIQQERGVGQTPRSSQITSGAQGSPYGIGGPRSQRDLNETPLNYDQLGRTGVTSTPIKQEPRSSPQSPVSSGRPVAGAGVTQDSSFHPSAGTGGKWYSLEPATPLDPGLSAGQRSPNSISQYPPVVPGSPYGAGGPGSPRDLNETPSNFSQFGQGIQSSTPIKQEAGIDADDRYIMQTPRRSTSQYRLGAGAPGGGGGTTRYSASGSQRDQTPTPLDLNQYPIKQEFPSAAPGSPGSPRELVQAVPPSLPIKQEPGVTRNSTGTTGPGVTSVPSGSRRPSSINRPIKIEPGLEGRPSQDSQQRSPDKDTNEDHSKIDLRAIKREDDHKPLPRSLQDMDFYKSMTVPESPISHPLSDELSGSRRPNLPDMVDPKSAPAARRSSIKPDAMPGNRRSSLAPGSAQRMQPSVSAEQPSGALVRATAAGPGPNGLNVDGTPSGILVVPGRKSNSERGSYNRRIIIIDEAGSQPLRAPREIIIDTESPDQHITRDSVQPWNTADTGALLIKDQAAAQIHRTPPRPASPVQSGSPARRLSGVLGPISQSPKSQHVQSGYPGVLQSSPQPQNQSRLASGSGQPVGSPGAQYPGEDSYPASASGPWMSLLPATPIPRDPRYHGPLVLREYRSMLGEYGSPQDRGGANKDLNLSDVDYLRFEPNVPFSSTMSVGQNKSNVTGSPTTMRNTMESGLDANIPFATTVDGTHPSGQYPGNPQYGPSACAPFCLASGCMVPQTGPQMGTQMGPQMGPQKGPQMGTQTSAHMGSQIGSQISAPMGARVGSQMSGPMVSQMGAQMGSQVSAQMGSQMGSQMNPQFGPQMSSQMSPQFGPQMGQQMILQSRSQLGQPSPQILLEGSQIREMESQMRPAVQPQMDPQFQLQTGSQYQGDPQIYSQIGPRLSLRTPQGSGTATVGVSSDRVISPAYEEPGATGQVDGNQRSVGVQDEDDMECFCERKRSYPPICAIPVLEYCESCGEFAPFFRTVPCPFIF